MFEHILLPLDGSQLAECVIPHAIAIAKMFSSRITLIQVLEVDPSRRRTRSLDLLDWQVRKNEAQNYLDDQIERFEQAEIAVETQILEGQAADEIIHYTQEHEIDLLVLSSHGKSGLSAWNISSVVQKIMLGAFTPIMIIRAYQAEPLKQKEVLYRKVFIPLDGSQRAECVLPMASAFIQRQSCQLVLAHVIREPEIPRRVPLTAEEQELTRKLTEYNRLNAIKYMARLQMMSSTQVKTRLESTQDIDAALHRIAEEEESDLVLLSAHGYSGSKRWPYGSTALSFIVYGNAPLLIFQDITRDEAQHTLAEESIKERQRS
ncbi:MAG: universal stress protein [Anaerolineaceae bacterium]|nr:universal stress protein [Anaerolineaceae bacterium]